MNYLRERSWYEDIYDRHTVEDARRGYVYYQNFYTEFESKLPKDDTIDRPGNALLLNAFYMQTVGNRLLDRYVQKEQWIIDWMADDEVKDIRVAAARLAEEPYCLHCSKQGLRIIDKTLMRRRDGQHDDPEEVLFMLECANCDKNSAYWEDGTAWRTKPSLCPKCNSEMTHSTTETKRAITIVYVCPSCGHSYKEKMSLSDKTEKPDPDYDNDRAHYCLTDKEFRDNLFEIRRGLNDLAELGQKYKEKEDNKHIYDAIDKLEKLKIVELHDKLQPVIEQAGYKEVRFAEPEIDRRVVVGISCLDGNAGRESYASRQDLKKAINKALESTNWRLMGDIEYRLGYLSGRMRAYESDEELMKLVSPKAR